MIRRVVTKVMVPGATSLLPWNQVRISANWPGEENRVRELIDNRAHRVRTLKDIIKHLHSGQAPEQVKDRLRQIVKETDYS